MTFAISLSFLLQISPTFLNKKYVGYPTISYNVLKKLTRMVDKKEEFRFDFTDDYVDYYDKVKEINNISKKVDVFRHAIKTTYDLDISGITPYNVIDDSLKTRIQQIIKRRDIQQYFHVYRYEDFLRNAVVDYLDKLETRANEKSILHWDVRNSLDGDQKEVALAIRELLYDNPFGDFEVTDISTLLKWRNNQKIEKILDDFVFQNLLEYQMVGGNKHYGVTSLQ